MPPEFLTSTYCPSFLCNSVKNNQYIWSEGIARGTTLLVVALLALEFLRDLRNVNKKKLIREGGVQLEMADTWEDEIDEIISRFEKQHRRRLIYSIRFY